MKRVTRASINEHTKRLVLIPVVAAFALTLLQPGVAFAANDQEVIVEKSRIESASANTFTSAALTSPHLPEADAALKASAYRLSYAGTALMSPGASRTVKYVAPAPKPVIVPVAEPVVILASAPAPKPQPRKPEQPRQTAPAPTRDPADGRTTIGNQEEPIHWGGWAKAGSQFKFGWCTFYAKYRGGVGWLGNAIDWYLRAQAAGYPTGHKPRKDAILLLLSRAGHVGIVTSVNGDGSFNTAEMNFAGFGQSVTARSALTLVPSSALSTKGSREPSQ
ncbi:MAG: CHAP domain-containing protein [Candidatus Andersenbacteria bacterium]